MDTGGSNPVTVESRQRYDPVGSAASRSEDRKDLLTESTSTTSTGSWSLGSTEDRTKVAKTLSSNAEQQNSMLDLKSRISADLKSYGSLSSGDYTSTSWTTFKNAMDAAKSATESSSASLSALKDALSDLEAAKGALVSVESASASASASTGSITAPVGDIQTYAHAKMLERGWSEPDWTALVWLWNRESGWDPNSLNASSGAYGIPQCLGHDVCSSMAFRTSYKAQIDWGLDYIAGRYGSPTAARSHSESTGWY